MSTKRSDLGTGRDLLALALLVGICLGIGGLGGAVTASSVTEWYPTLNKPSFNPPNWVFGPVWTTLYAMMGIAAWRVWRSADRDSARGPLAVFALQLAVNLGWSIAFFGLRDPGLAVAVILVLDLLVLATALMFRRIDGLAALLLVPYLAWIAFATVLNFAVWRLN
ncbi:TspO/MBR family protein [uncultured Reyranella sp.]|uniref:TspO/MBR family protein n=1 Tax=uncultured Reyranella sp. TaxID=735512 RepID=UPI0025D1810D|nr:TspO/MBR family protein [uncultured Reyranella sp.]